MGHKNMEIFLEIKSKTSLGYEKDWAVKPDLVKKCRHKASIKEVITDDNVTYVICSTCNFYYIKKGE